MRAIAASVLVFEGMVVFFALLVALDLSEVEDRTIWWGGTVLAVALLVAAALLRRPWGYWAGSVLQVGVLVTGFVVPAMFVLGAMFAGLWFFGFYLQRKVERIQRQRGQ